MGKLERKLMGHLIDASFGGTTPEYVVLGDDLEEFNIELNPETDVKQNILGETTFVHNGYKPTSEVTPYYAKVGDALFEHLQEIIDTRATGDACKTDSLEVHMWDGSEEDGFTAWKQACYVVPTSHGGDISGYQIPFTVNYVGKRVKGKYDVNTRIFTEDSATTNTEG